MFAWCKLSWKKHSQKRTVIMFKLICCHSMQSQKQKQQRERNKPTAKDNWMPSCKWIETCMEEKLCSFFSSVSRCGCLIDPKIFCVKFPIYISAPMYIQIVPLMASWFDVTVTKITLLAKICCFCLGLFFPSLLLCKVKQFSRKCAPS